MTKPKGTPPSSLVPSRASEFILYQTEDDRTKIDVRLDGETVWLSLNQIAELFQRDKSGISKHIRNIFAEGELRAEATVAKFATVQREGDRDVSRSIEAYNLDVIISVGYRVKSHRGTQFRMWATQRLREYLVKGFTLDDERLKEAGGGAYFDELLERIRDIRSSEKVFWRKVLDVFATSIDYDPNTEAATQFFATVQNKMHWAAHGHTAAEVIAERADAEQTAMGLTSWRGTSPRRADVAIAKNYLRAEELELLNRIVMAYLEVAELQAKARHPMYMSDWSATLNDFLKLSRRDLLTHAGRISHEVAAAKADGEYEKFRQKLLAEPSAVDRDFDAMVEGVKKLPSPRGRAHKPGKKS